MKANGKNLAVVCLALCMGWCLAQPTTVKVSVPDYVVDRVGDVDYVSIPGGRMLVEEDGRPVVPYFVREVELPAGLRVQDVALKGRSGLKTDSGLRLPTVQPDLGPAVPPSKEPFPDRGFAWSTRYEDKPALYIIVYPFRYEPKTGRAQFYKEHDFEVRYGRSMGRMKSVTPDQAACDPGDTVRLEAVFENTGREQHASVTVVAQRAGDKPVEVASRDVSIGRSDTLTFVWHTRGVPTGVYDVEVVIRDQEGNELDRNGTPIRVGIPRGELTAFRAVPDVFKVGDDIKLVAEFKNTGSCDLVGTAVFLVAKGDEPVDEMREEMGRTKPGASRTFRRTWSSAGAERSAVYFAVGYVEYEGTACEPARVMFSTNRMPVASFTVARDTVAAGEEVAFGAGGSKDADGTIVAYRWEFGDGGAASGVNAVHTWMQPGEFTVRLTVVDNEGGAGAVTKVLVVEEQQ